MNNMISTDPSLLGVDLPASLIESPSVSTFLPEEDASICPLLPNTPSPPPMAFSHPLTPSADNDSNNSVNCEDTKAETSSSSGSSSGIAMDVTDTAATSLFNKHAYKHLGKTQDNGHQENGIKSNGLLDIPITKGTPGFVSWNWPFIRKCTLFVFMSSLLGMCALVIAMIIRLPNICNPTIEWYRGSVFYEIFPASFQDSNNDGLGDLRGIASRLDYLETLGIGAIRLNSIFPSKHYPDHYQNITSLTEIDEVLGTPNDLTQLAYSLHSKNMSLLLDLPVYPFLKQLDIADNVNILENDTTTTDPMIKSMSQTVNMATEAMRLWLSRGVDGFYVKGLEYFQNDPYLLENIAEWKYTLGKDRILIVSEALFENLDPTLAQQIMKYVDLIEVHLDITNGTKSMNRQIKSTLSGILAPTEDGPWIQWSIGGVSKQRMSRTLNSNATKAATIMQLMLPGTPNIFYGDEVAQEESHDPHNEHDETKHLHHLSAMSWSGGIQFTSRETLPWLPHGASAAFSNYDEIMKMVNLRETSPPIYKNAFFKDEKTLSNTNVRHSKDDILIIERTYPRRNTFVSISNFGSKHVGMDLSAFFYSGRVMLGKTQTDKIYFGEFEIGPLETVVVRLDK